MLTERRLPGQFLERLKALERSYLSVTDPIRQSGFGGGAKRWQEEREPILEAIDRDGELLDIGCANGYLLECLMKWGRERGLGLIPYGLDIGPRLIDLAKKRFPDYRDNFYVGNGWDWRPPKKFFYAYTLYDCVPEDYLEEYIHRLLSRVVAPSGRLIIGAYGSKTNREPPFDVEKFVRSCGYTVAGYSVGGNPPVALFVWIDNKY
jgi:hypothetical protein